MNSLVQIFENSEFGELEILVEGKQILFPATECAIKLGYSNSHDAISRHCKGVVKREVGVKTGIKTDGSDIIQIIEKNFILEGDLYRLIARSKLPAAEKFEIWVFDEVLPSIRKHGAFLTPDKIEEVLLNPDTIIRLATELKAEREARTKLEIKVEEDKPKVIFADSVVASNNSILIRELAKLLKQNGIETGEKRLFEYLRNKGYLIRKRGDDYNTPTQRAMEMGLFEVKKTTIAHSNGDITVSTTPKVTGKGQLYFINKFKEIPQYK